MPLGSGMFGIDNQFDIVRATFDDGTNVPRIPPMRVGGGVYWRDANWLTRINLLHAFAQNDVAPGETTTPGYNNLRAELSYTWRKAQPLASEPREFTIGIAGTNLLDEDMRNSASFNKDDVLLPGASVRVFASVKY
jgi:iron complex outermembrane receptor protein